MRIQRRELASRLTLIWSRLNFSQYFMSFLFIYLGQLPFIHIRNSWKLVYRLHTVILHWPLSSAATKEVQGPDTTGRRIQGLLFLACWWYMGTICTFWPLLRTRWLEGPVWTPSPPSDQPGLTPPPLGYLLHHLQRRRGQPRRNHTSASDSRSEAADWARGGCGFSARLYKVRELSWRPAQVDQRASS